jgi:hypothetical protein
MNSFYVVEFIEEYNDYKIGDRFIVWVFTDVAYVRANSDMEYIPSKSVKRVYKIKFELIEE